VRIVIGSDHGGYELKQDVAKVTALEQRYSRTPA
jgi:ribose 5-phosphate isomerase RpiB